MSDYSKVTFRERMQAFEGERTLTANDRTILRKAVDPRKASAGVEVIRTDSFGKESVEFVSLELVSSITYAPVSGTAVVAAPEKAGGK